MSDLEAAYRLILHEAESHGSGCALVGGFAVSVRTEPRFTRDIDLVVAVADDAAAEEIVAALIGLGHEMYASVEQTDTGRLATSRLRLREGQLVDLIFASSGIEFEIVEQAEVLEVLPGINVRVASVGHLIALKLLDRDDETRPQDVVDLRSLVAAADAADLGTARRSTDAIVTRGYGRGRDLVADLDKWVERQDLSDT